MDRMRDNQKEELKRKISSFSMTAKTERNDLVCVAEEPVMEREEVATTGPPCGHGQPQSQPQDVSGESSQKSNYSSRKSSLRRQECVVLEDEEEDAVQMMMKCPTNADVSIFNGLNGDLTSTQSDRSSGFYDVDVAKMTEFPEPATQVHDIPTSCASIYVTPRSEAAMRQSSPIPSTSLEVI